MIENIIISSGTSIIKESDSTPFVNKLTPSVDVTPPTIYWFRPYEVALFPGVTIDKKYMFLYSTDHGGGINSAGGVYLGKGDNLDLSDFQEVGLILSGNQSETPFLYYFPDNPRPIHLYYHTDTTDPSNGGIQRSKVRTTTGGDLINSVWVQETDPLGEEVGDQHLGYLKFWDLPLGKKAIHYKQGSSAGTGETGVWQFSTTTDGLTFTRGLEHDTFLNVLGGRRRAPTFGWYFKMFNQWWNICTIMPNTGTLPTSNSFTIGLFKCDDSLNITEQVRLLNGGLQGKTIEVFIKGSKAHIYLNNYDQALKYATYDLNQLQNYLT